ncbi:hypothetical protein [Burkholderia oklahomensis]|uniref:hypothetical protein n=1 Tax=Burkholderia oklahomensis TaxID=342113 RepID=UPI001E599E9E|nr:hypothetical protein [Burkholderia oklahomensis]
MFIFVSPCRPGGASEANALRQKKNGVLRTRPPKRPDAWDTVVQVDRPSADDPEKFRDAAPASLPMTRHIQQYPGQRRPRTRRTGAKTARPMARASQASGRRARRAGDGPASACACRLAGAGKARAASLGDARYATGTGTIARPCRRRAPRGQKTRRRTRPRADLSHADSAASHHICASLPHRVSSARGAKSVHVGAMPRRVSFSAFWHGTCLAIFGESTTIRFAAPNTDPPGNGLPGQRRPTHPVTRPGSQDAVFVW